MLIEDEKIVVADITKVKLDPDTPGGEIPEGALDELVESI